MLRFRIHFWKYLIYLLLMLHCFCSVEFNITDFVMHRGWNLQQFENVQTEDGYLLTIYRITGYVNQMEYSTKEPVLLMHDFTASAETFVALGPRSIAFSLAELGYDVWLGNTRGSNGGRNHVSMDPENTTSLFWNFTWHEMGIYDLPAIINFITSSTEKKQIFFVGHGQGALIAFVMLTEIPKYNEIVKFMCNFAPPIYIKDSRNGLIKLLQLPGIIEAVKAYVEENLPQPFTQSEFIDEIVPYFCKRENLKLKMCTQVYAVGNVSDEDDIYKKLITKFLGISPSAASIMEYIHYAQIAISGEFQKYNYGPLENLKLYKSTHPPKYLLKNIKVPSVICYGRRDTILVSTDMQKSYDNLPRLETVVIRNFTHLDFIYSVEAQELIYDQCTSHMERYLIVKPKK